MPLASMLLMSMPVMGQWLHLTTAGVPRRADGSPNLEAPARKTADGKPDFSGMWVPREELGCNEKERGVQCTELPLTPQVINIATGLKGGLPYQPWAAELVKKRRSEMGVNDPHTHCMPPNYPRAWAFPETQKIIQTPGMLVVLHEFNASYRQIFFDGRGFPDDMVPAWSGYSVAHWEGDTLVVETTALREQEDESYPHSDQAVITERYHLTARADGAKVLVNDWTLTDPAFYTRPVSAQKKWLLDPKGILLPYECNEEGWLDHLDALRKAKAEGKPPPKAAGYP